MANDNNANNNQPNGQRPPQIPQLKARKWLYWFWAALLAGLLLINLLGGSERPVKISWDELEQMIVRGDVTSLTVINDKAAEVALNAKEIAKYKEQPLYKHIPDSGSQFVYNIGNLDIFRADLNNIAQKYGIDVPTPSYEYPTDIWGELLGLLPYLLLIVFIVFMFRSISRGGAGAGGQGVFNVGKAQAQIFDKNGENKITFKDVAGLEEAKVEIMEIVDFLRKPQKYKDLGGKIPKGALLVGPPGTGKTLLAKAVAGEANVPFFSISGSDFVEMFVGVGASRVRDLFHQAKEKAPCIVFIDEIDAIGRARGKNAGFSGNDERENTLNQLLTEMDGFGTNAGVIVLAATNRADILDKALMRAGRFDRQIEVGLPDIKEREEIFNVHLKALKLDPNLDRSFLAKQTPGFSGADIANVCNEAALIAARNNKSQIEREDFLSAIDRIIGGLEKKNKIITKEEKRAIAFHEAGHATVSWLLEYANPLIKVTIIPRGKALGAAWYLPEERQITTREQLMDEMASLLGGRVSEQLTFGAMSTGALNDLERATKMAQSMVAYYGMSDKVGNLSFYDSTGENEYSFSKPYSEETAQMIDHEVKAMLDKAYAMAEKTLKEHRDGLKELAELLLDKEVVFSEDLERIFGKRIKDIKKEQEEAAANAEAEHAESAETQTAAI